MSSSTFIAFEADKLTYHHAGLTEFDLYKSAMVLMKDVIYTFLGEPHFVDNEQEKNLKVQPQKALPHSEALTVKKQSRYARKDLAFVHQVFI